MTNLTRKDIEDAIHLGVSGLAEPYLLHHVTGDKRRDTTPVLGVVYTPFIRVALAAAARRDSERLTPDDVPQALLEPIIWVAFRWYCCDRGTNLKTFDPSARPLPRVLWIPPQSGSPTTAAHRQSLPPGIPVAGEPREPLWVTEDTQLLASFGDRLPFDDIVLVAAFPLSGIRAEHRFILFKEYSVAPGASNFDVRWGRTSPEDIRLWR